MEIEMKVKGLVVDPISKMPIVVLENPRNEQILPIWIGVFEANAIALTIENVPTPRPSDAIALALRMSSPIYVEDEVVKKANGLKFDEKVESSEKLRKWLETLRPEDFGKYKM